MNTPATPRCEPPADAVKVVSVTPTGPHTYELTTESAIRGLFTQSVLILPRSSSLCSPCTVGIRGASKK
jgi:hypothetical protein